MVIAFAGRRIDAPEAQDRRFPPEHIAHVAGQLREALQRLNVRVLVSAAACGSDLLALEAAADLGARSRIVLPFGREQFRATSVVDRPGRWGELYDAILVVVEQRQDLLVLEYQQGDAASYPATNRVILAEAQCIAGATGDGVHCLLGGQVARQGRCYRAFSERVPPARNRHNSDIDDAVG
jgi:hypothetical protein